jgi:hypothetical protein
MTVLLNIKDDNALPLLEVLKGLPYVKTTHISAEKAILLTEIKEAVDNLNLVKKGLVKAKSAKDLYNELGYA